MKQELLFIVVLGLCTSQANGSDAISKAIDELGATYSKQEIDAFFAYNVKLHTKRANQGDVYAQEALGRSYKLGIGVSQNYFIAFKWYQKAANQNSAYAQYQLGTMYKYGEGVRQNRVVAKEWYGKACDNGYQFGCDEYKILNQKGY